MWTPIANMCEHRSFAGVGVFNGELYVVSGRNRSNLLSSVEKYRPSTSVWTTIADILLPQKYADVLALNGLLYVIGGMNETSILNSAEYYNPNTNTWAMVTSKMNLMRYSPGLVAINRPKHFTTG
ncbi:kelch-like protein 2 [Metopolophium dirhodum]|uniref:kelch-like protein 2 n=1 Tax=Metopolophium dirhodum TaxID=44670 RepID=UPI00298FC6DD|nr:kelch-like protein 2 [Metopolophium dirhodum]